MTRHLALLGVLALVATACNDKEYGSFIGRPPITPVDRPSGLPLGIDEVYAADADPATHYAVVTNAGDEAVSLDGLSLCDSLACVGLEGSLEPDARLAVDAGALQLSASAGEVAVLGEDGTVHAYLPWGASPRVLGSELATAAVNSGAAAPGALVRLPYPTPAGVAVARLASGESGCATPTQGSAELAVDASLCPAREPVLQITELMPAQPDGGGSWVEITSLSEERLPLFGVRLCQPLDCFTFRRDDDLTAGGRLVVYLGVAGETAGQSSYVEEAAPLAPAGEVALLAPGPSDLGDVESMQSYVRYGEGPAGLAPAAVQAGLWPAAGASVAAPAAIGESLSLTPGAEPAAGLDGWNPVSPPTPGADNPDVRPDTDLWLSCSAPRPWNRAAPSALVVQRISNLAEAQSVELLNRGEAAVDLDAYTLSLDAASLPLGIDDSVVCAPEDDDCVDSPDLPTELEPGATLVVTLAPSCTGAEQTATSRCWAGPSLQADPGELTLVEGSAVRQHLQWAAAPTTVTWLRAQTAVDAGAWPLPRCALPPLQAGDDFTLTTGAAGQSPADYTP